MLTLHAQLGSAKQGTTRVDCERSAQQHKPNSNDRRHQDTFKILEGDVYPDANEYKRIGEKTKVFPVRGNRLSSAGGSRLDGG